jgi:transcriptional regulator with XRE-family HTH domain
MDPLKVRVGRKIKWLRERHGLSLQELGNAAGVSEATMISIEKGRTATNVDILERIARQLGVDPAVLISAESASGPLLRASPSEASVGPRREIAALLPTMNEDQARATLRWVRVLLGLDKPGDAALQKKETGKKSS